MSFSLANVNHESKSSDEPNTSGSKKLSSAHSSCRLFCSGVPVTSRRFLLSRMRMICDSIEFSFLMRCACVPSPSAPGQRCVS